MPVSSSKKSLSKTQLTKAAKMRDEGKSWSAIREATGTSFQSSTWFSMWAKAGIAYKAPANQAKRLSTLAAKRAERQQEQVAA